MEIDTTKFKTFEIQNSFMNYFCNVVFFLDLVVDSLCLIYHGCFCYRSSPACRRESQEGQPEDWWGIKRTTQNNGRPIGRIVAH